MAFKQDKHLDPNKKARWGFTMKDGQVVVGDKSVGETGGVETIRTEADAKESRKNGSGTSKTASKDTE